MADLEYKPDYVFTRRVDFHTVITAGLNGKEQRRSKGSTTGLKSWNLVYNRLSTTAADAIWSFYIGKKGATTSFSWLNPVDAQTYTVRFVEDSFAQEYIMHGRYQLSFSLKQVPS